MKVLVLGASGMLGNAMLRVLALDPQHDVWGSARSGSVKKYFSHELANNIITGIDVENIDSLARLFAQLRPEVVVNCIGLVKQLAEADDPLYALPINSLLPHRLARLCELVHARLVHISTDCVFSGRKGRYVETDEPDAQDLYGRSKLLGEVEYQHTVTLRTSIIGHELHSAHALIDWFLAQQGSVNGFSRAVFSGLPTVELARVMKDFVLPRPEMSGLFHVAAEPISKLELLRLVAARYGKMIEIRPDDRLVIDRSLDGSRFQAATGYTAPAWTELVARMHTYR